MTDAALQRGPRPRVQRRRVWTTTQSDAVRIVIDVGVGEMLQFLGGGAVQKGGQPD